MLALRPQARFGGQPGRKARLLGRRSSRGRGGCGKAPRNGQDRSLQITFMPGIKFWPARHPWFVGEGFIPPVNVAVAAKLRGRGVPLPYEWVLRPSPFRRAFALVCRAGDFARRTKNPKNGKRRYFIENLSVRRA